MPNVKMLLYMYLHIYIYVKEPCRTAPKPKDIIMPRAHVHPGPERAQAPMGPGPHGLGAQIVLRPTGPGRKWP